MQSSDQEGTRSAKQTAHNSRRTVCCLMAQVHRCIASTMASLASAARIKSHFGPMHASRVLQAAQHRTSHTEGTHFPGLTVLCQDVMDSTDATLGLACHQILLSPLSHSKRLLPHFALDNPSLYLVAWRCILTPARPSRPRPSLPDGHAATLLPAGGGCC